jgi:hypothetical protein
MITPEEVAKLAAAATEGPWRARDDEIVTGTGLTSKFVAGAFRRWNLETELEETAANAAFIAAAHDMADLVAEQDRLLKLADELAGVMEEYSKYTDWFPQKGYDALAAYRTARGQA